jgi:hypothetical protein
MSSSVRFTKRAATEGYPASSFILPTALAGTGAWALKADRDIGKALDDTDQWYKRVVASRSGKPGHAVRDAFATSKEYAEGGRNLLKRSVGGIPVPGLFFSASPYKPLLSSRKELFVYNFPKRLTPYVRHALDLRDSGVQVKGVTDVIDNFLKNHPDAEKKLYELGHAPDALRNDIREKRLHYKKFLNNKKYSDLDLQRYVLFGSLDEFSPYSPASRKILSEVGEGKTFFSAARELAKTSPDDYEKLKGAVRNKSSYLAGKGLGGFGNARLYAHGAFEVLPRAQKALRAGGSGLLGAGVLLGLHRLGNNATRGPVSYELTKKAALQNADENLLATGAGLGAAGLGFKSYDLMTRPIEIGFSHSENIAAHGAGHKTPGVSLKSIVDDVAASNPNLKIRTSLPVLSQFNTFKDPSLSNKVYDYLIDTGMGTNVPENYIADELNRTLEGVPDFQRLTKRPPIQVRPGGWVGYLTDLGKLGVPGHVYFQTPEYAGSKRQFRNLLAGERDKFILWGNKGVDEDWAAFDGPDVSRRARKAFEFITPSKATGPGFPAMSPDAMNILDDIYSKTPDKLYNELLGESFLDDVQRGHIKEVAAGNKKLLMVTGSARGDNVAWRMKELQDFLDQKGLADKYTVSGVLGESYSFDPLSKELAEDPRLLSFKGRIPQKWYVGLPALADRNWASTGTSAAMETLASPVPATFMDSANAKLRSQIEFINSPEGNALAAKHGLDPQLFSAKMGGVDLDGWNPGNKAFALERKNTKPAQTAQDFIEQVLAQTDESKADARAKGYEFLQQSRMARQDLKDQFLKLFQKSKARNLRHGRYAALGAGGLAALPFLYSGMKDTAATGPASVGAGFMDKMKHVQPPPPITPPSIDPKMVAALGGGVGAAGLLGAYLLKRRKAKREREAYA